MRWTVFAFRTLACSARFFPALVFAVLTVIVAVPAVIKLVILVASNPCFEIADTFSESFCEFRYFPRPEQNYDYHQNDYHLGHSKTHHKICSLNRDFRWFDCRPAS